MSTRDVSTLLGAATLAEKVALLAGRDTWTLYGVERLGVPSIWVADGPYGLRKARASSELEPGRALPATCFPTSSALAASWDPALVEEVSAAIGREARAEGVSVVLGPGTNIKRTPLCGRNFEYFSEDPLLSSRMAAAWIRGVQGEGVGASLKHFAANNQEHRRYTIDTLVDERALREIYLASFEEAVAAAPWTVMAAYNRLDGVHCTEHPGLLTGILRDEWGFDGVVVSDWGAVRDRAASIAAGMDLEMPGYGGRTDAGVLAAVADGRLSVEAIDRAAGRVLGLIARSAVAPRAPYDQDAHHALALRAACEGTVLLKNEGLVPLAAGARIAVVGPFAKEPRYQGAGSAVITPHRVDDAWTELSALAEGRLAFAQGCPRSGDAVDEALLAEAREVARAADVVVVFVGLPERHETEGVDREHLRLPASHDALVAAMAEASPRVVVVLSCGAPVQMPWHERVGAVVLGYLGGQAGGSAVARVLLGHAEPGGRLAETFPHRWEDDPVHALPTGPRQVEYREGVFVGYRWYDTARQDVLFPFGHGLATTTFAWSEFALSAAAIRDGDDLEVAVTVTNTGERAGAEVVQVYVHDEACTVPRPDQELRGFAKVRLAPGESRHVRVVLGRRAFAFWDVRRHGWTVESGRFEIRLGASSRDIRATASVEVSGETPGPVATADPVRDLDRGAFAARYGRPLPENALPGPGAYTHDTPIADMTGSWAARLLLAAIRRAAARTIRDGDGPLAVLVERTLAEMPLPMLTMLSGGKVGTATADALLHLANGQYRQGLGALLRALRPSG